VTGTFSRPDDKSPHQSPQVVMPAHHIGSYLPVMPATDRNADGKEQMGGSTRVDGDRHEAGRYEVRLRGHLDGRWVAWFDGLSLSLESDGTTVIRGPVADQAALHGLLQKVRDIGLPLVSVMRIEPDQPAMSAAEPK
jgi:hypothetical protein